jgi:predicted nucleic acid-binding protein
MRPLLDINVLLDHYLSRSPWSNEAGAILRACQTGMFHALVAAHTITTLNHIVEAKINKQAALAAVDECLRLFDIVGVDGDTLRLGRGFAGKDYEDDVQIAAAVEGAAGTIVTRDSGGGFTHSPIPIESPADFVARLGLP